MKSTLLLTALAFAALAVPASAQTTTFEDPIHGACAGCVDNGVNTPINSSPPVQWGFNIDPAPQTGTLYVDFLVPNTYSFVGGIDITGAATANASLVSLTPWTVGFLETYLGISATPNQPIGAYLPAAQGFEPGATGFNVYQANLGTHTLLGSNIFPPELYNASDGVYGMYIVAFLSTETNGIVATANSGALLTSGVPEPSTWAMMLLGFVGLGVAFRQRRRITALAA